GVPGPLRRARRGAATRLLGPRGRVLDDPDRPAAGARPVRFPQGPRAPRQPARPARAPGTGRRALSFLTPLYILGAVAIVAPIVFHLIRRRPQGEVPFSSLMFLDPTPPRLTRRSRLDNWLLLLLRAAALGLLALAFARPFLRESARLDAFEA